MGEDINFVMSRKFVIIGQELKEFTKTLSQGTDYKSVGSIINFWTNDVTDFLKEKFLKYNLFFTDLSF